MMQKTPSEKITRSPVLSQNGSSATPIQRIGDGEPGVLRPGDRQLRKLKNTLTGNQFQLFQAVQQNDVMLFLDAGGFDKQELGFEVDDIGNTLLHLAVHNGDKIMV